MRRVASQLQHRQPGRVRVTISEVEAALTDRAAGPHKAPTTRSWKGLSVQLATSPTATTAVLGSWTAVPGYYGALRRVGRGGRVVSGGRGRGCLAVLVVVLSASDLSYYTYEYYT